MCRHMSSTSMCAARSHSFLILHPRSASFVTRLFHRTVRDSSSGTRHSIPTGAAFESARGFEPRMCVSSSRDLAGKRTSSMPGMTFGVFVPQGWKMDLTAIADPAAQYDAMTTVAQAADQGPWDSIWVFDH